MVGLGGLEPPTSRLSSVRSNQLSYKPSGQIRANSPVSSDITKTRTAYLNYSQAQPQQKPEGLGSLSKERETRTAYPLITKTQSYQTLCRFRKLQTVLSNAITKGHIPFIIVLRKEVIQPQVPLRLPCYDFTPVADPTVVTCLLAVSTAPSGRTNSHGVTGGVYKARERIHRGMLIHDY